LLIFVHAANRKSNFDIFVSRGQHQRPTKFAYDFAAVSDLQTESLEIGLNEIFPSKDMSGAWIIAVYARKGGEFTIASVVEDQSLI